MLLRVLIIAPPRPAARDYIPRPEKRVLYPEADGRERAMPAGARGAGEVSSHEREVLDAQYAGERTMLRPVMLKVREAALGLGDDVRIEAREDEIAFVRHGVFAVVRPESATQVDLGLALRGPAAHDRLIPAPSFEPGITHRVPLTNLDDFDGQAHAWLRQAYEQDGE
jgi:hypothetical protein